jgi:hypothetical protein
MNWRPPSKHGRFEGDVGVSDLRHRLSLDPDLVPEPPARMQRGLVGRSSLAKISICVGLVAIVTYTVVEINLPYIDCSIAPYDVNITKTARLIATPGELRQAKFHGVSDRSRRARPKSQRGNSTERRPLNPARCGGEYHPPPRRRGHSWPLTMRRATARAH